MLIWFYNIFLVQYYITTIFIPNRCCSIGECLMTMFFKSGPQTKAWWQPKHLSIVDFKKECILRINQNCLEQFTLNFEIFRNPRTSVGDWVWANFAGGRQDDNRTTYKQGNFLLDNQVLKSVFVRYSFSFNSPDCSVW